MRRTAQIISDLREAQTNLESARTIVGENMGHDRAYGDIEDKINAILDLIDEHIGLL